MTDPDAPLFHVHGLSKNYQCATSAETSVSDTTLLC
uniref:Uncharacterized protein n=1 Tax=Anguilla anguilla TaxID=7936 RepID=A0A0E9T7J0_ANGAN